ncbi:MAG: glutathione S-transferase family protein [Alphaproteobacteria bacterium]
MANPTLYGPAYSTYARTARLAMEENGVKYALEEVDIMQPRSAVHMARQPWGKVPAFEHDGFKIYETQAIARYIDESFGGAKLQPADTKKRARMNQILGIFDSYGYPSMISAVVIERMFSPKPDENKIKEAMVSADKTLDALEGLIGDGKYLADNEVTLADLMAVPIIDYFAATPEGKAALAKRPKVSAWWNRIKDRPSVTKTKPNLG